MLTAVTRGSLASGATACSSEDWKAGSVTLSVGLLKIRMNPDPTAAFWGWISLLISFWVWPAARSAPNPPFPASVPPVRTPTIESPSRSAETTSVAHLNL